MTKEERKAYNKAYREAHREEIKARLKSYHEAHKEELKAKHKAYREVNWKEEKARSKIYGESEKGTKTRLKYKLGFEPPKELIELHHINLKIKRLCKTLNN